MVQTTSNGAFCHAGSTTEAKLQLAHGGLCLALEHGQTVKLVLGDCGYDYAIVFTFAGFADSGKKSQNLYEESSKQNH